MKLLEFTIIKLSICLIIGIFIAGFIAIPLDYILYISTFLLPVLFVSLIISRNQFIKNNWFGSLAFLTTISIGILIVNLHNEKNFESHYTKFTSYENNTNTIVFKIREILKSSLYHDKYVVDILKIEDDFVSGKLLLNIEKDSIKKNLNVDDEYQVKTTFSEINTPLNPHQFNYKNYLKKQYIYHQIYINNASLFNRHSKGETVFGLAAKLRETINLKLTKYNFKYTELSIINALLLGQRQDINKEIYDSYAKAGAIHILAVSGLHVGIILMFLSFVFKPIENLKHGKTIKTILIIAILWCFAIVAGLSASVTRAVTMFSVIAIAIQFKRATNMFNTVAISMFILLLFKPMFLYDVGFQLSYAAVFAIVSIYPLLYKFWKPKYYITDKLWQVLVVTISAQFGVVPLSLFYFHQFPGLFFLSNLVIVPLLGFILGFGIIVILLALLNIMPDFLAKIYGRIISLMNDFVGWISFQEEFLIRDISFSLLFVIASYIIIITFIRLLKKKNCSRLAFLLLAILFGQCAWMYSKINSNTNEFIVFHKSRYSIIGSKSNSQLYLAHNLDNLTNNFTIRNYVVGNNIKIIKNDTLKNVYAIKNKTLLVLDSLGIYNIKRFNPDYVLLRNSPRVNLNRLIDSISPKLIIADGSNYKSYINRWKVTCKKRKLPFYQTGKKGAFIID